MASFRASAANCGRGLPGTGPGPGFPGSIFLAGGGPLKGLFRPQTFELLGAARTWKIAGQTVGMATVASLVSISQRLAYVLYRLRFPGGG